MRQNNRAVGNYGENIVAKYLKKHRYKILERNYNTPYGEIDIVAYKKGITVFVEVKSRSSDVYGTGREAVTATKQRHLVRSAEYYLVANNSYGVAVRFDVAEVNLLDQSVTYIEDAVRM